LIAFRRIKLVRRTSYIISHLWLERRFSSTPHPLLIHSSSTPHPLLIHSSSSPHPLLIHSSSTPHPLLIHSSSTPHPQGQLARAGLRWAAGGESFLWRWTCAVYLITPGPTWQPILNSGKTSQAEQETRPSPSGGQLNIQFPPISARLDGWQKFSNWSVLTPERDRAKAAGNKVLIYLEWPFILW
jgi:hypothetical protein